LKKQYSINVLGQELSVLSDSGDDHVANVVQYVKEKLDQAKLNAGSINILNISILVALNIADEHLKLTEIYESIISQLESKTENLISLIDDVR